MQQLFSHDYDAIQADAKNCLDNMCKGPFSLAINHLGRSTLYEFSVCCVNAHMQLERQSFTVNGIGPKYLDEMVQKGSLENCTAIVTNFDLSTTENLLVLEKGYFLS